MKTSNRTENMRLRTGLVGFVVAGSMAFGGAALAADVTVTVEVAGPTGQFNHGQVVSNFVRALKLQLNEAGRKAGIGCLVRMVAQADNGKGEDQGGPTTSGQAATSAAELVLTLDDASCEADGDVEATEDANGPGKGKGHAYGHSKGVGNPHSNANR